MRVLTKKKVEKIKQAIADGTTQPEIAKRFEVSRSIVSDIATGRVHKDVDWPNGEPPTPKRAGGQHKNIPDYDPTDKKVMELEAEIVHLTDERNRERQKVKAGAKIAGLFKAVVAEMDQRVKPLVPLPPAVEFRRKAEITEHVVMHLSDGHHDQVVVPDQVGGLEEYNFPISCCRAERYVNTVVEWTQDTLAPKFAFPRRWPTPWRKSWRPKSNSTTSTSPSRLTRKRRSGKSSIVTTALVIWILSSRMSS